jgi:hypothetical protein
VVQLFREWGDAWVEDSLRTDRGKPRGVFPAAIAFETEQLGGYGDNWYQPQLYWDYFNFPGGGDLILEQLLATYALTGDEKYLLPIEAAMELADRAYRGELADGEPGSEGWVAHRFLSSTFYGVWGKYRLLTGKKDHDHLLWGYADPYTRWYVYGEKKWLNDGCRSSIDSTKYNFELKTSEVRFTDRVGVGGAAHLFSMYTGGGGNPTYYPCWEVSWIHTTKNFAALVFPRGCHGLPEDVALKILAHNFEPEDRLVGVRLWRLEPGTYQFRVGPDANHDNQLDTETEARTVTVGERGTIVTFNLPSRVTQALEFRPLDTAPRPDVPQPDLALTSRDIAFLPPHPKPGEKVMIRATIHNVGSAPAENLIVRFVEATEQGTPQTEIGQVTLKSIPAPLDLLPQAAVAYAVWTVPPQDSLVRVNVDWTKPPPYSEITAGNNAAVARVPMGEGTPAGFAEVFWAGAVSPAAAPVWWECAEQFLRGDPARLSPERAHILLGQLGVAERLARTDEERASLNALRIYLEPFATARPAATVLELELEEATLADGAEVQAVAGASGRKAVVMAMPTARIVVPVQWEPDLYQVQVWGRGVDYEHDAFFLALGDGQRDSSYFPLDQWSPVTRWFEVKEPLQSQLVFTTKETAVRLDRLVVTRH